MSDFLSIHGYTMCHSEKDLEDIDKTDISNAKNENVNIATDYTRDNSKSGNITTIMVSFY